MRHAHKICEVTTTPSIFQSVLSGSLILVTVLLFAKIKWEFVSSIQQNFWILSSPYFYIFLIVSYFFFIFTEGVFIKLELWFCKLFQIENSRIFILKYWHTYFSNFLKIYFYWANFPSLTWNNSLRSTRTSNSENVFVFISDSQLL